jgi:hypothetical protein
MAVPGTYSVSLAKVVDGEVTELAGPESFDAVPLMNATLPAEDRAELLAFQKKTARLQRAVLGAVRAADEAQLRIDHLQQGIVDTPAAGPELAARARELEERLLDLRITLEGDPVIRGASEPTAPGIVDRVDQIVSGHWTSTAAPTGTHRESYQHAAAEFGEFLPELQRLIEEDLKQLEDELEALGGPWTPGRVPRWQPE